MMRIELHSRRAGAIIAGLFLCACSDDAPSRNDAVRFIDVGSGATSDMSRDEHPADLGASDTSRDVPTPAIALCEYPLGVMIERLGDEAPRRGDGLQTLPVQVSTHLETSLRSAARGDLADADIRADAGGFDLCQLDASMVLVWSPRTFDAGQPMVVVDLEADANAVQLEHPHPFFDGTLDGALPWWEAMRPRSMILSGSHRCASDTPSGCDGRTSVCEAMPAPYPLSDPAHATTLFHRAHVVLSETFPDDRVISVHGTGQSVGYISDGTRGAGIRDNLVAAVTARLGEAFAPIVMRPCDAYDTDVSGPWLCGTTNVQGRHLNGAADACNGDAPAASGRFLHLEQPRSVRDQPALAADALIDALGLAE